MSRYSHDESAKQQTPAPRQALRARQVAVLTGAPDYGRFLSHKPLDGKPDRLGRSSLPGKAPDCTSKRNPPIQTRHLALIAVDRTKISGAVDCDPGDCLPDLPDDGGNNSFALSLPQSRTLLKQPLSLCNRSTGSDRDPCHTTVTRDSISLCQRALSYSDNPECTHSRANHAPLGLERTNWQLGRLARISLED
jgi:hypothetical protein